VAALAGFGRKSALLAAALRRREESVGQKINWSLIVPWVLTVATAAIGFWQFTEQQR
jgi:hypothetical protein